MADLRDGLAALHAELAGQGLTATAPNQDIQHWLRDSHPTQINHTLNVPAHNTRAHSPMTTDNTAVDHIAVAPVVNESPAAEAIGATPFISEGSATLARTVNNGSVAAKQQTTLQNASNSFPATDGPATRLDNRGSIHEEEPTAEAPAEALQSGSSRSSLNPLAEPFVLQTETRRFSFEITTLIAAKLLSNSYRKYGTIEGARTGSCEGLCSRCRRETNPQVWS